MIKIPLSASSTSTPIYCLVDDSDAASMLAHTWHAQSTGNRRLIRPTTHIMRGGRRCVVSMPRFILGITNPQENVCYRDGNNLNCQRANMYTKLKAMRKVGTPRPPSKVLKPRVVQAELPVELTEQDIILAKKYVKLMIMMARRERLGREAFNEECRGR